MLNGMAKPDGKSKRINDRKKINEFTLQHELLTRMTSLAFFIESILSRLNQWGCWSRRKKKRENNENIVLFEYWGKWDQCEWTKGQLTVGFLLLWIWHPTISIWNGFTYVLWQRRRRRQWYDIASFEVPACLPIYRCHWWMVSVEISSLLFLCLISDRMANIMIWCTLRWVVWTWEWEKMMMYYGGRKLWMCKCMNWHQVCINNEKRGDSNRTWCDDANIRKRR